MAITFMTVQFYDTLPRWIIVKNHYPWSLNFVVRYPRSSWLSHYRSLTVFNTWFWLPHCIYWFKPLQAWGPKGPSAAMTDSSILTPWRQCCSLVLVVLTKYVCHHVVEQLRISRIWPSYFLWCGHIKSWVALFNQRDPLLTAVIKAAIQQKVNA